MNKRAVFYALLDCHDPDIVIGTESWLSEKHFNSEFSPNLRILYLFDRIELLILKMVVFSFWFEITWSSYLYRKADWEASKTYMDQVKQDFLAKSTSQTVEQLWSSFKTSVNEGLAKFVPCKKFGSKRSFPWITQEIKRLIRKRDSLYLKHKRLLKPEDGNTS